MTTAWVVTGIEDDVVFQHMLYTLEGAQTTSERFSTYESVSATAIHRIDINEDTGETTFTPEPLAPEAEYLPEWDALGLAAEPMKLSEIKRLSDSEHDDHGLIHLYRRNSQGGFDLLSDKEMKELLK